MSVGWAGVAADGVSGAVFYICGRQRGEAFSNKITGRPKMEINFYLHISESSARVLHSLPLSTATPRRCRAALARQTLPQQSRNYFIPSAFNEIPQKLKRKS